MTAAGQEPQFDERGERARQRISEQFTALRPHPLASDGRLFLTRVEDQRLLRLSRLAVAVSSQADRTVFFRVLENFLVANSVMKTYRAKVALWAASSSRTTLDAEVERFLVDIRQADWIDEDDATSLEHQLLEAIASLRYVHRLRALRIRADADERRVEFRRVFHRPSRQEMPEFLRTSEAGRDKLELASQYASDRSFEFPTEFVDEVCAAVRALSPSGIGRSFGHTREDLDWERLGPLASRLAPLEYATFIRRFLADVARRNGDAAVAWAYRSEGYGPLVEADVVHVLRDAWIRWREEPLSDEGSGRHLEAYIFSMLLPHLTPIEQMEAMLLRGDGRRNYLSFESGFHQLPTEAAQQAIADHARTEQGLHFVLWYATKQEWLCANVWLALIDRGARSSDSVVRAFSAKLLMRLPEHWSAERAAAYRAVDDNACPLERHWVSLFQLLNSSLEPQARQSHCSLEACAEVLGGDVFPQQDDVMRLFAEAVFEWAERMIHPDGVVAPDVPMKVSGSIPRRGYVSLGVDHAQVDNSVSYRAELSTWGGLSSDDSGEEVRRSMSGDRAREVFDALNQALDSAIEIGDWGYRACWSDETVRELFLRAPRFEERFFVLWERGRARRRLRSIGGFLRAAVRYLLISGHARSFELWHELLAHKVVVRQVDSYSENDLLEEAFFSFPDETLAEPHWLRRFDACKSDAHILACCELLVAGGNRAWLLTRATRELELDASYFTRRGLLMLAGSGEEVGRVRRVLEALGDRVCGIEEVAQLSVDYGERLLNMRHWLQEVTSTQSVVSAKCAAELLLHCADHRLWDVLSPCRNAPLACGCSIEELLPESRVKSAIKKNSKALEKTLLGYRTLPLDVHPWLPSETDFCIELRY